MTKIRHLIISYEIGEGTYRKVYKRGDTVYKSCRERRIAEGIRLLNPVWWLEDTGCLESPYCELLVDGDLERELEKQFPQLWEIYKEYEVGQNLSLEDAKKMENLFGFYSEIRLDSESMGLNAEGELKFIDYGECHMGDYHIYLGG